MKKLLIIIPIMVLVGCDDGQALKREAMMGIAEACQDEGDVLTVSGTVGTWSSSMTVTCQTKSKGNKNEE